MERKDAPTFEEIAHLPISETPLGKVLLQCLVTISTSPHYSDKTPQEIYEHHVDLALHTGQPLDSAQAGKER